MRHTLYLSILVLSLVTACTKEADMNIAKESEHTVKKNLFRVTRIEGHNDHWGDYIWIINYNKEQIESAFHIDTEGDTICLLYTSPSPRDGATSRMPSSA